MKIRMRLTITGNKLSSRKVVETILEKMRDKTIPELKGLFLQTTEGWEHSVNFGSRQWHTSSEIGSEVFPEGSRADIYSLVSQGAPRHPIPLSPKRHGFLRFQTGYNAATRPGFLRSSPKSRSGDFVRAKQVNHPGFQARDFPQTIKLEYEDTFVKDMQEAINEAVR